MSYVAIARKYRPSTFDRIVGQEHVTRTLRNAIRSGRIHHAFLFCGARGVGKTTAARALARALNCREGPTPDPCGTCSACREILAGASPDLIEIDGASNNSVDDIRELRETVHYAPTSGAYKIYLIDEVHMLSKAAFNALLKTLEEPPPHVVFLFATTEPNKILDTILSRVQRFDFKRIGTAAVVDRLREIAAEEGASLTDAGLRLIARAGDGSMRDAQSLLDKVISFGGTAEITDDQVAEMLGLIDRDLLYGMLEGIVEGQPSRCLDAIAAVHDYGYELAQFTSEMLDVLRNAAFVRLSDEARRHVELAEDELARLDALVADVPPEVLTRTFSALLEVHDQVSRAPRPRPVLEMAVARLATQRPVQPVAALLERLDELVRRLRAGGHPPPPRSLRTEPARSAAPERKPGPAPARPAARPRAPAKTTRARATKRDDEPAPSPSPEAAPPTPPAPAPRAAQPAPEERAGGWGAFAAALRSLGDGAAELASADHQLVNGRLILQLPAGRPLAEGRRAARASGVLMALAEHFGPDAVLDVVPVVGTGTEVDQQHALREEVLADAACQRIIETLGAQLETVTSLREPGEPQDGTV